MFGLGVEHYEAPLLLLDETLLSTAEAGHVVNVRHGLEGGVVDNIGRDGRGRSRGS